MNNWRDYIPEDKWESFAGKTAMLVARGIGTNEMSLHAEYLPVEKLSYTEDTIGSAVLEALKEFPVYEIHKPSVEEAFWAERIKLLEYHKLRNLVARNSRRGIGNRIIKQDNGYIVFYSGTRIGTGLFRLGDSPLSVCSFEGKYEIAKNPNFDTYGFVVRYV